MNDKDSPKDWRELCKAATTEMDPNKFMDLIVEINRTFDELDRKQKLNLEDQNYCRATSLPSRQMIA
jgi:hypothetical protein